MKSKMRIMILSIWTIFTFAICLYLYGCTSPGLKMRGFDENGTPIVDAYVVYGYTGIVSKIVDSDYYRRPGTVVQTDVDGSVLISSSLHMRAPFFQNKLYPRSIVSPPFNSVVSGFFLATLFIFEPEPFNNHPLFPDFFF